MMCQTQHHPTSYSWKYTYMFFVFFFFKQNIYMHRKSFPWLNFFLSFHYSIPFIQYKKIVISNIFYAEQSWNKPNWFKMYLYYLSKIILWNNENGTEMHDNDVVNCTWPFINCIVFQCIWTWSSHSWNTMSKKMKKKSLTFDSLTKAAHNK